jgi:hypothetical protein
VDLDRFHRKRKVVVRVVREEECVDERSRVAAPIVGPEAADGIWPNDERHGPRGHGLGRKSAGKQTDLQFASAAFQLEAVENSHEALEEVGHVRVSVALGLVRRGRAEEVAVPAVLVAAAE